MKSRKAGLPKREPPWSVGGQLSIVSSIESSIDSILWIIGCAEARAIEEIFLSAAESEREKTKERMREWVGDERKMSWSRDDKIRRVGS